MQQVYWFCISNHNNSNLFASSLIHWTITGTSPVLNGIVHSKCSSWYNDKFGGKSNQITMATKFMANNLQKLRMLLVWTYTPASASECAASKVCTLQLQERCQHSAQPTPESRSYVIQRITQPHCYEIVCIDRVLQVAVKRISYHHIWLSHLYWI